jgi:hypothetical protein
VRFVGGNRQLRGAGQSRAAGTRTEELLALAAGGLVLAASLLNLLLFNDYPLFTTEVLLLIAAVIAIASIMVPVYTGQRRWGKALLAGLLTFLAVDLNTDSTVAAAILGLAASIASWKMGSGFLRFLAILAVVAMVTSLLGLTERTSPDSVDSADENVRAASEPQSGTQSAPPLIVHIILDEMGGIAGLSEIEGRGEKLGRDVRSTLTNAGFAVDSLAYTPWTNTIRSVAAALDYDERPEIDGTVEDGGKMGQVEMLRELRQRGYALKLWQTSYLDFCSANSFDECVTSNINHLRILRETSLPASDRAVIIGANLLSQSMLGRVVSDGLDGGSPPLLMQRRYLSTLHAEKTLRELAGEVRGARSGEAYVAHVLLPHYPFSYNSDCSLRRFDQWEPPWSRRPIEERWRRYEQQYRCALRRLLEIASAIDESAAAGNAVLIVHGDHGPRIRDRDFADDPTLERTILSTLFAVRRSGQEGSVVDRQCPIGVLLAATMKPDRIVRRCTRQFFYERGANFTAQPISDWSRHRNHHEQVVSELLTDGN